MNTEFKKRIKSFMWRTAMIGIVAIIDFFIKSLVNIEISNQYTVIAGLILGEISKYLNKKYGNIIKEEKRKLP